MAFKYSTLSFVEDDEQDKKSTGIFKFVLFDKSRVRCQLVY